VTAPTNGVLGTCTSSIAAGTTCQFSCNAGYGVSGPTSCSAAGALTAATCTTAVWISRNAVPAQSYMPAQGAGTYDTFMYTYIAGAKALPIPANRGEFYKYASSADTWTTGGTNPPCAVPALPRESGTPSTRSRVAGVGECGRRPCLRCCLWSWAHLPPPSEYRTQYPSHARAFLPCWAAMCVVQR
jgi:hypothetical protein